MHIIKMKYNFMNDGSRSQNGGPKPRDIALDAVCCSGTIKCRSRGINRQSHFVPRFVPSRHLEIFILLSIMQFL